MDDPDHPGEELGDRCKSVSRPHLFGLIHQFTLELCYFLPLNKKFNYFYVLGS